MDTVVIIKNGMKNGANPLILQLVRHESKRKKRRQLPLAN